MSCLYVSGFLTKNICIHTCITKASKSPSTAQDKLSLMQPVQHWPCETYSTTPKWGMGLLGGSGTHCRGLTERALVYFYMIIINHSIRCLQAVISLVIDTCIIPVNSKLILADGNMVIFQQLWSAASENGINVLCCCCCCCWKNWQCKQKQPLGGTRVL